jgi:hypothetical protein
LLTFRVRPKRFGSFRHAKKNGGDSPKSANSTAEFRIIRGLAELLADPGVHGATGRVRCPGGGRKKLTTTDATLLTDLRGLVEPTTGGDPEAPLLWTSRSLRNLAEALRAMGHRIGYNVVADLLRQLNYSLQANRKTREGSHNPDRNAQFGLTHPPPEICMLSDALRVKIRQDGWSTTRRFTASQRSKRPVTMLVYNSCTRNLCCTYSIRRILCNI